jgi:hypothetical protein
MSDLPELVTIEADEAYHDAQEGSGVPWTAGLEARVTAEIRSRHAAYAKVWQAGREPLALLLDACRERLTRCAEHHGLATAASRDIRRLVQAINEELDDFSQRHVWDDETTGCKVKGCPALYGDPGFADHEDPL